MRRPTSSDVGARGDKVANRHLIPLHFEFSWPVVEPDLYCGRNKSCNVVNGCQNHLDWLPARVGLDDFGSRLGDVDEVVVGVLDASTGAQVVCLQPPRSKALHEETTREDCVLHGVRFRL